MSFPDSTTLTPVRSAGFKNKALATAGSNLPRKALLVGTYDSAKTGIAENIAKQYLSPEAIGVELGFRSPLYQMAKKYSKYGSNIPLWVIPQGEAAGATAASGTMTITGPATAAGTLALYVSDKLVSVGVASGDTATEMGDAAVTAITAAENGTLPVTVTNAAGVLTVTSTAKGTYGNSTTLAVGLAGEVLPAGVSVAIVAMSGGATDPDVTTALETGLGTGDAANAIGITDAVAGYEGTDSLFAKLSAYVGAGNELIGCWAPTVNRPIRFISVDTTADSFNDMKTITDGDLLNRAVAYVAAPAAYTNEADLAAEMLGYVAMTNQAVSHATYVGAPLSGHVASAGVWTNSGSARDTAIKTGISVTRVINNTLYMDGMVTMYRPLDVAVNNNAYRSFRNISVIQNLMYLHKQVWADKPWATVVEDIALVDASEKPYVLDVNGVIDIDSKLATIAEGKALLFNAQYTIDNQVVTLREANNGFDIILPMILSAEGVVSATTVYVDINLAVVAGS